MCFCDQIGVSQNALRSKNNKLFLKNIVIFFTHSDGEKIENKRFARNLDRKQRIATITGCVRQSKVYFGECLKRIPPRIALKKEK